MLVGMPSSTITERLSIYPNVAILVIDSAFLTRIVRRNWFALAGVVSDNDCCPHVPSFLSIGFRPFYRVVITDKYRQ